MEVFTTRTAMLRLTVLMLALTVLGSACRGPVGRRGPDPAPQGTAPVATTPVTIEVFGTPGLQFEGSYGALGETQPVSGTVPTRLTLRSAVGFTVALQKRARDGELGIKVIVGGRVVSQSSTKKVLGLVAYTHRSTVK
ncbi:MAG: hypothetical protein ACRDIC_15000 [bacterium]